MKHLVLVGLPGSGKSATGRLVASWRGFPFHDVDTLIEERASSTVTEIFRQEGEAAFRDLEKAIVDELVARPAPSVISPGGGWICGPGNLERIADRSFTVYLETPASTASDRVVGAGARPLLEGEPLERMEALLRERAGRYREADATVSTRQRSIEEVARRVEALARTGAGW